MTAKDLSVVVRGVAPIIREYVASSLMTFADGLKELSTRVERGAEFMVSLRADVSQLQARVAETPLQGPQGERGASCSVGSGLPTENGKSGDVYIDAATGDIYQWR